MSATQPDVLDGLPAECQTRLRRLVDEVLRVNQQFNLTAIRDSETAWERHILDSLQALPTHLLEGQQRVIDVGSGAGFPGLALAVARPDLHVTLLEATGKKCRFIESAIAQFGLDAGVLCARAEDAGQDTSHREKYDLATARAVGSLAEVCELCLPLVRVGGSTLLWRGEKTPDELKQSKSAITTLGGRVTETREYSLPHHSGRFYLVVIEKQKPTPRRYPRRVGLPKKEPL